MKALGIGCVAIIGLVVLVALVGIFSWIGVYNGLNSSNQGAAKAWGDIESTLQRRADLIPNLVAVVQRYAKHEKETLTAVTEARAKVGQINLNAAQGDPAAMKKLVEAQGELSNVLSRLMVVVEKYPDLKADQGFRDLQAQLEGTENRINVARQRYNGAVETYNTRVHGFFGQLVAGIHGFEERPYFKADEGANKVPVVKFD